MKSLVTNQKFEIQSDLMNHMNTEQPVNSNGASAGSASAQSVENAKAEVYQVIDLKINTLKQSFGQKLDTMSTFMMQTQSQIKSIMEQR